MRNMASVELRDLGKTYPGGTRAVDACSLTIRDGEFLVLVGPSGCGKSTLLRMIAGLEERTDGSVAIDGTVVDRMPPKQRDIAMVFQNYALYPHMSARKNMEFGLKLRRMPRDERRRRVEEVAGQLGITELLDRKPGAMSGGQQQRVALGRAIVREPKVFLFDEPLSNLDAKLRTQMRAELKSLHQRVGTTSIYVTHDQEEAMTLGDRVVVMHGGCVQQCGRPMDVYRHPANRFVAGFIGAPTMNFIDGRIDDGRFRCDAFEVGTSAPAGPASLGIRPEHLVQDDRGPIELQVRVSEPLGDAVDVVGDCGGHELVARLRRIEPPRSGDVLRLAMEPDSMHLFDEAGNALAAIPSGT